MTSDAAAPRAASASPAAAEYRERLIPGPGMFLALLLVVPAVALIATPININAAIPSGIIVYLIAAVTLILLSPTIRVAGGELVAGHASIPVSQLGEIELLGAGRLRAAIGPGLDARSYLLVRGWVNRGIRIENIDPNDPAPVWIITTRHPQKLAETIRAAQAA